MLFISGCINTACVIMTLPNAASVIMAPTNTVSEKQPYVMLYLGYGPC